MINFPLGVLGDPLPMPPEPNLILNNDCWDWLVECVVVKYNSVFCGRADAIRPYIYYRHHALRAVDARPYGNAVTALIVYSAIQLLRRQTKAYNHFSILNLQFSIKGLKR